MTIFRLNFLLKVGQMKVCQNPSFISTSIKKNDFLFVFKNFRKCHSRSLGQGCTRVNSDAISDRYCVNISEC